MKDTLAHPNELHSYVKEWKAKFLIFWICRHRTISFKLNYKRIHCLLKCKYWLEFVVLLLMLLLFSSHFYHSDAEDAVKARDGYDYDGYRLRVEFPRGGGPGNHRSNRNNDRNRNNRGAVTKRSQYRVLVSGLPPSGSWQDLKDHMREAGDVCFADTYKDGTGVVEFLRYEDMKYAIKKLDDSRFRSHEVRWNKRNEFSSISIQYWLFCPIQSHYWHFNRAKLRMSECAKTLGMIHADHRAGKFQYHIFHKFMNL